MEVTRQFDPKKDLSPKAWYAFCFALAMTSQPGSRARRSFVLANAKLTDSQADRRQALADGLRELMDVGIVECDRDGEGDYVPRTLHLELVANHEQLLLA